jgi:hypothetical protein
MKEIKKRVIIVSQKEILRIVVDYLGIKGKCEVVPTISAPDNSALIIVETVNETDIQVSEAEAQCEESTQKSLKVLRETFTCKDCKDRSIDCGEAQEICRYFIMKK